MAWLDLFRDSEGPLEMEEAQLFYAVWVQVRCPSLHSHLHPTGGREADLLAAPKAAVTPFAVHVLHECTRSAGERRASRGRCSIVRNPGCATPAGVAARAIHGKP
jgi:hypothetical protein